MAVKKKKKLNVQVGDLVEYHFTEYHKNGRKEWEEGIVKADARKFWVMKGHVDIKGCIVSLKDIRGIIKKQFMTRREVEKWL